MIRIEEVRARVEDCVPQLRGKFQSAGKFADLVKNNQLPQVTPAGFVLFGGLRGGTAEYATGAFVQNLEETVSVVVVDRYAGDARGGDVVDQITPLVREVITAVCSWGPDDAPGVFVLRVAELVAVDRGALIFEINFALNDQLRIFS